MGAQTVQKPQVPNHVAGASSTVSATSSPRITLPARPSLQSPPKCWLHLKAGEKTTTTPSQYQTRNAIKLLLSGPLDERAVEE